jgi:hypothetical protein
MPVSHSEEEDAHDSEEDVHGIEEDHLYVNEDEANQVHSDSRSPLLDTIDKLTEPIACNLFDDTGINVELAQAKVFPLQKSYHAVLPVRDGYVVSTTYLYVGQCGSLPSTCTN